MLLAQVELSSSRCAVVAFCLLALEGDAVSAYILFKLFPVEEMFPAIAAIVWFILAIIAATESLKVIVFLVFSAAVVDSMSSLRRSSSLCQ